MPCSCVKNYLHHASRSSLQEWWEKVNNLLTAAQWLFAVAEVLNQPLLPPVTMGVKSTRIEILRIITLKSTNFLKLSHRHDDNSHSAALWYSGCCRGNEVSVLARRHRLQSSVAKFSTWWSLQSQEQRTAADWWQKTRYNTDVSVRTKFNKNIARRRQLSLVWKQGDAANLAHI